MIRGRLRAESRKRDLALFNLAIDSKLSACDLVALQVKDVCHHRVHRSSVNSAQRSGEAPPGRGAQPGQGGFTANSQQADLGHRLSTPGGRAPADVVKVGLLADFTGAFATWGPSSRRASRPTRRRSRACRPILCASARPCRRTLLRLALGCGARHQASLHNRQRLCLGEPAELRPDPFRQTGEAATPLLAEQNADHRGAGERDA
jgi:hypothetical protein